MTMTAMLEGPRPLAEALTEPPLRNKQFAAIVERHAAGRSNRVLADLTKVNATSIGDMRWGRVVGYRLLQRFADGLELSPADRRELFAVAGYADEEWDPDAAFMAGVRALAEEFGQDVSISAEALMLARETPEGVEAALAAIRKRLEKRNP